MALTLTSAIGPTDRVIAITGTVPDSIEAGYEFRIDDERFVLTTFGLEEVQYPVFRQLEPDRNSWVVRRGVAVSHDAGAEIKGAVDAFVSATTETPPTPFASSGGGGSLSVDNGVDPPAEVTTLVAPGAAVDGDTATLVQTRLLGPFHVTFETPGLENPAEFGVVVGPVLLPGTVVVSAWFVVTETWVGDVDQMQVNIVSADGLGIAASPSLSAAPYVISHPVGYAGDLFSFVFLNVSAQLAVSVWMSSGSLSGGEADIYALATTPV